MDIINPLSPFRGELRAEEILLFIQKKSIDKYIINIKSKFLL